MTIQPSFSGETQFVTFTDSSKGGPRVTLRLSDRDELAAFIGKEGKRYMCVLVEIADDETPATPPVVTTAEPEQPKGGKLARDAAVICADATFQAFAHVKGYSPTADGAAQLVRTFCAIESRSLLDHNREAAMKFGRLMTKYREWRQREAETC